MWNIQSTKPVFTGIGNLATRERMTIWMSFRTTWKEHVEKILVIHLKENTKEKAVEWNIIVIWYIRFQTIKYVRQNFTSNEISYSLSDLTKPYNRNIKVE